MNNKDFLSSELALLRVFGSILSAGAFATIVYSVYLVWTEWGRWYGIASIPLAPITGIVVPIIWAIKGRYVAVSMFAAIVLGMALRIRLLEIIRRSDDLDQAPETHTAGEALREGYHRSSVTSRRQGIVRGAFYGVIIATLIWAPLPLWARILACALAWFIYAILASNTRLSKYL